MYVCAAQARTVWGCHDSPSGAPAAGVRKLRKPHAVYWLQSATTTAKGAASQRGSDPA